MNKVPLRLRDPVLRVDPRYFGICTLSRVIIGLYILTNDVQLTYLYALVVLFFYYKMTKNPRSWKNYARTMYAYTVCFVIGRKHPRLCGLLIITDALIGQQSRYEAENYLQS